MKLSNVSAGSLSLTTGFRKFYKYWKPQLYSSKHTSSHCDKKKKKKTTLNTLILYDHKILLQEVFGSSMILICNQVYLQAIYQQEY